MDPGRPPGTDEYQPALTPGCRVYPVVAPLRRTAREEDEEHCSAVRSTAPPRHVRRSARLPRAGNGAGLFNAEADAMARANATEFGVAASVWSRDVDRPLRVGRNFEAGTVWANTWAVIVDQMEEDGFKQSGVGRLNGERTLEEFQEIKAIVHPAPRRA
ncbi:aldehyde dehydrogenase family protein [Streptomyces sp. NPDC058320]|uniref:aldehyde dehydrogenase family protein n=1 Tax=unclassified Streptomyces TaxID=2593676 RepID=UPI0036317F76